MAAWRHALVAVCLGIAFVLVLEVPALSAFGVVVTSNVGQLAAVAWATVLCWRASRAPGVNAAAWRALTVGVGGWAAGQAVWTCQEVVHHAEVPFPSLADVGFLVFPVASAVGLLAWLGAHDQVNAAARGRDLMDGGLTALSLLVLSWVTSLGAVASDQSAGWLTMTLSLAYPVGDVVIATLVLMALTRGRSDERAGLTLLAVGLGSLSLADSAYLYLVSLGEYTSADGVTGGWVLGFLFVGAAARHERTRTRVLGPAAPGQPPSPASAVVPYLAFAAAGSAVVYSLLATPLTRTGDVVLGVALAGVTVTITISVGVARHCTASVDQGRRAVDPVPGRALTPTPPSSSVTGADLLVRLADQAMYAAKKAGKSRAVLVEQPVLPSGTAPQNRSDRD